jgi:hypothetical protein
MSGERQLFSKLRGACNSPVLARKQPAARGLRLVYRNPVPLSMWANSSILV